MSLVCVFTAVPHTLVVAVCVSGVHRCMCAAQAGELLGAQEKAVTIAL